MTAPASVSSGTRGSMASWGRLASSPGSAAEPTAEAEQTHIDLSTLDPETEEDLRPGRQGQE
eukprot:7627482-Pyramimonas_sp.AAC.1